MAVSMSIATLNFTDDKGKTWRLCDIADLDNRYSLRRPGKIDFIFVHENMPAELLQRCLYGTYICNGSKVHKKYSPDLYSILYGAKDMTSEDEDGSTIQLISTGTDSDGEYATTPDLMTKRRFIRAAASLASVGLLEFDTIRLISGYTPLNNKNATYTRGAFRFGTYGSMKGFIDNPTHDEYVDMLIIDSNYGNSSDNPMAGHGSGTEIKPYNISLLPVMVS